MIYGLILIIIAVSLGSASAYLVGDLISLGKFLGFSAFMIAALGFGLMLEKSK